MTDTKTEIKWFYRALLLLLGAGVTYVVIQPAYNFAHWVPHSALREVGFSYAALLSFEQHADKLLHPVIACALTILLGRSEFAGISQPTSRVVLLTLTLTLFAELNQYSIGRGFDLWDVLLGALGIAIGGWFLSRGHGLPKAHHR